jgi:NAD(P)-dependent dehydrogenase (short-subunit alcohol dehydrogenase family)
MAEAMVDCGADVTIADINPERLETVEKQLAGRAGGVRTALLDVTDHGAVRDLVQEIVARDGGLDVAFVNAGLPSLSPRVAGELDGLDEGWDRTMAVNLTGAFATMKEAAVPMREQGSGRIIVTTSTAGIRADPNVANAYIAAKAALINLTRQAALTLAPYGVRVNAIAPGPFHTGFGAAPGKAASREDSDARWKHTVPIGRIGDPTEIKGLALLLASTASSYITGGVFPIDGGALIAYVR